MKVQYIRFVNTVMSPGRANQNIAKAYIHAGIGMVEERMDDIAIEGDWVVMRAVRKGGDGKSYVATRRTHVTNVRDFEELEETDEQPAKGKDKSR